MPPRDVAAGHHTPQLSAAELITAAANCKRGAARRRESAERRFEGARRAETEPAIAYWLGAPEDQRGEARELLRQAALLNTAALEFELARAKGPR